MFQKHSSKPSREDTNGASQSDRSKDKPKNEKPAKTKGATNVILSDVEITGSVKFKNDVIIDGRIEGEIESDGSVTIGREATVRSDIRAKNVTVEGCVCGDIYASDRLELGENAEVTGDIKAAVLSMQAGAVLVGTSSVGALPKREEEAMPESKHARNDERDYDRAPNRDREHDHERDRAMAHA